MLRLALIVAFVGLVVGSLMPSDMASVGPAAGRPAEAGPASAAAPVAITGQAAVHGPSTVLERADNGHFYADAQVNGMPVRFVVDTGASGVALTAADAQRVGLQFSSVEFGVIGSGASGPVSGKHVTLDRVTLDGKTVENVDGAILANSEMSLLGQSFLGRMGQIEISGDRMTIR